MRSSNDSVTAAPSSPPPIWHSSLAVNAIKPPRSNSSRRGEEGGSTVVLVICFNQLHFLCGMAQKSHSRTTFPVKNYYVLLLLYVTYHRFRSVPSTRYLMKHTTEYSSRASSSQRSLLRAYIFDEMENLEMNILTPDTVQKTMFRPDTVQKRTILRPDTV